VVWLKSRQDELVAVQTYTASIVTLLTLGAVLAGELNEAWERGLRDVRDAMAKLVPECELASREWVRPFERANVVYLLARGPSMASAFEGSLMLNEAAKIPSVAFSSSNFRHGAIEVVDSGYRGIVFATPGPAQELSFAMARDVIAFGGRAHVITTQAAPFQIPTWRVPEVPAVLMPAVEIIPVQMLTLRLAQSRSIPLGRFRYAAQITRAEEGSEAAK
jgi:glucosamine--fructose-6-phosphate aminotransferase (isomerizing)